MPWFLTPHGPHFVVEPGTIDEYERRDYVVMTAQQVTDYYAGVAFPDPPSFATEAEVVPLVTSAVTAGTGALAAALNAAFGLVLNVRQYGAKGDVAVGTGSVPADSTTLTLSSGTFTSGDVGKAIQVAGAGAFGAWHVTTIASVSSSTVATLTSAAVSPGVASRVIWATDDTDAFQAALADAEAQGGRTVVAPRTAHGYWLSEGLDINVLHAALAGDATILRFPGNFNGVALQAHSDSSYTEMHRNTRVAASGLLLHAGGQTTRAPGTGLRLGHATDVDNGNIVFEDCHVQGFTTLLSATHNAWRYTLERVNMRWGAVTVPQSLANMGEQITVNQSMWDDIDAITIGCGSWVFNEASLDNAPLEVNGDAQVWLNSPHLENPGNPGAGYRMLSITHAAGMIHANNVRLVINQPSGGGNWEWAPFYVTASNTTYGLDIDGIWMLQAGYLQFDVHDGTRILTAGGGRAVIRNTANNHNFNGYALADWSSRIRNGGAETGTTIGWTKTGTGTHAVDNAAGNQQSGTYSHKVTCTSGQTALVFQDFAVTSGQYIWGTMWRKLSLGTGGSGGVGVLFFDQVGNYMSAVGSETLTVVTPGSVKSSLIGVVPQGAVRARVEVSVAGGSAGTTEYWFDNVVVNVA